MKRSAPLILFLTAFFLSCSTTPVPREPVHVVIVGTTDVHGWYNGHIETPRDGGPGVRWGGLPILSSYLQVLRAENPGRVVLVDSGDMFQGTLESNLNEGEAVIRGYNALGYDAAAVGNHEFDFGPLGPDPSPRKPGDDPLGALKRNARLAAFPLLSANMTEKATGRTPSWASPHKLVTVRGAKIGIIGLSTPDTPAVTLAINVAALNFTDPVPPVVEAAKVLRARGADAVIVIAHMGGRCTDLTDTHSLANCDRQQEAVRTIEALPAGTIDAWFAGHTHAQMRHFVNGVATVQGLAQSREFSVVDLYIDPAKKRVIAEKTEIRPPTMICAAVYSGTEQCDPRNIPKGATLVPRQFRGRTIEPDLKVQATVEPYLQQVAAKRAEKVGITTAAQFGRSYLFESPLGNLIADALKEGTGADFAIMNAGGIRAELPAGELTYSDVFEVSPFDNYPAIVKLTGKQLQELLNLTSTGERGIMQVSGLKYTYDANIDKDKPFPQRRRLVSVTLPDGNPLEADRVYTVAMPDFIAGGGDGSAGLFAQMPKGSVTVLQEKPIRDMFIDVLSKHKEPLVPKMEGRVTALNDSRAPKL